MKNYINWWRHEASTADWIAFATAVFTVVIVIGTVIYTLFTTPEAPWYMK